MKPIAIILAAIAVTPALASDTGIAPGIQNHAIQRLFLHAPCGDVIAQIDSPAPTPEGIGGMVMAFGVLMGYELARPGISGPSGTLLERLRDDCTEDGARSASAILEGYTTD